MKPHQCLLRSCLRACASIGLILAGQLPLSAQSQITPGQASQVRSGIGNRVEALTILGGDYGLGDGTYHYPGNATGNSHSNIETDISKIGGYGEVGDPQQLGRLGIGWQPRFQGSVGYLDSKNEFDSGLLKNDTSESRVFAIQFGGGARFWLNENLSLAPTFMGMFGHTTNEYTAHSAFMVANLPQARRVGLVDWNADTWTVRPALDIQYVYIWDRTIFTLSSDPTYFHTSGTNHFAHSGRPSDDARVAEYEAGPYANYENKIMKAFSAIVPPDADAAAVGDAIARIVDMPFGKRPFRVHIDPTQDGAEVAFTVIDRMRTDMLHRVGLDELLVPVKIAPEQRTN